jgi:redox-sensitive bicupin YhaK (pirin superfamily)
VIAVRPARERLHTRLGWLDSWHTFTFEEHIDPRHMGYRALRVLNEDRVAPGRGYGSHPRRDLELVSYVIAGTLRHHDSLGTDTLVEAGGIQRLSAGTGVLHGEANASDTVPLHVLHIWIAPARTRLRPRYGQRACPLSARRGAVTMLASGDGRDGSLKIHQDVALSSIVLKPRERASYSLGPERHGWAQVVNGSVALNGVALAAGDGAAVSDEVELELTSTSVSETLLFDLA